MASGRVGNLVVVSALSGAALAGVLLSELASAETSKGGWLPPLPSASASAATAAPGAKPPSAPAAAGSAPPGYMYEEPWIPPSGGESDPSSTQRSPTPPSGPSAHGPAPAAANAYQPPPPPYGYPGYVYEPPPPPVPLHRAPGASLWLGLRGGILFPSGYLYDDGTDPYYPNGPSWSDVAGTGPLVELNAGARFARRYLVFAAWEHAALGTGGNSAYQTAYGSQTSARTDFAGMGFRWSSSPDDVGLALELGLGYRWFKERWANGSRLSLEGFGEFRFGVGADIRISRVLAISPMFMVSEGVFNDREIEVVGQPKPVTYTAAHQTVTLTLGAHFDLFGSK
jgi:hypothetical protein